MKCRVCDEIFENHFDQLCYSCNAVICFRCCILNKGVPSRRLFFIHDYVFCLPCSMKVKFGDLGVKGNVVTL